MRVEQMFKVRLKLWSKNSIYYIYSKMRFNASFFVGLLPVIESNCPDGSIEYWLTEPWDFGGKDSEGVIILFFYLLPE